MHGSTSAPRSGWSRLGANLALGAALAGALLAACSEGSSGDAEPAGGAAGANAGSAGAAGASAAGAAGAAGGLTAGGLTAGWRPLAASYLEARSHAWLTTPPAEGNVKCALSCHTTYPYLLARHALGDAVPTPVAAQVRTRFGERVAEGDAAVPFYGHDGDAKTVESAATEAVLNAASLSLDEVWSGRPLSDGSRAALDRMWSQQRGDGSWAWLEFGLEPWETRTDFGLVTGLLVASQLPAGTSSGQAAGAARLATLAHARLASMSLHDRAWLLWVGGLTPDLLTASERAAIAGAIVSQQLPDGGFSAGGWGQGARAAQVSSVSDGYATSVAVLALCAEPSHQDSTARAIDWLTTHQAADGSWPGQSVNSSSELVHTFMTDAATAYAVLALTRCGHL